MVSGAAGRAPTLLPDDLARPLREVDRWQVVVGAVEDVIGEHLVDGIIVALGSGDLDQVEAAAVVLRRRSAGGLRSVASRRQIALGQSVEHHDVGRVDDRATNRLVEAVAVEEPAPAAFAEVVEGQTLDQAERCGQVVKASAPRASPRARRRRKRSTSTSTSSTW